MDDETEAGWGGGWFYRVLKCEKSTQRSEFKNAIVLQLKMLSGAYLKLRGCGTGFPGPRHK